ncbi:unnamed protein product [Meloidogyne enterolobii]|uniref:Uncharacterized protein n=1 Tax=Meloidogyne enterolobii TaxID=390850 RepID=A0ACB0ZAS6_MELEN
MFLKLLIFLLIINKIIASDSNSGDSGNENSNSKPSDEFVDSVDVRENDNEQQPSNSIDNQNLQDPQFIKDDDTNALLNNEENNRINEYTTEKIKKDEEDQLNNEGSIVDNEFPEEDNDVNGININTTAKYLNDVNDNDNNESDGQGCVYEDGVINDNGEERTPTSDEQKQIEEYLQEMREFEEQMVKDSANFMRNLAQFVMSQFENIFGSSVSSLSRNNNNLLEKKPVEAPTPPCLCKKCDSMAFIHNKQNKYFKNFAN